MTANATPANEVDRLCFRDPGCTQPLSAEEETELFKRMEGGDRTARSRLLNANSKLVALVANNFAKGGERFEEFFQEGNIGLIKALERFDWRRGFKFSTYAVYWIRQAVIQAASVGARIIRLPTYMAGRINRIARVSRELAQSLGREPADREIAGILGWETRDVALVKKAAQEPTSLDAPAGGEEDASLASMVADKRAEDPVTAAAFAMLREEIARVLSTLTAREQKVMRMRYGLGGGCPQSLEDVARSLGISRERVRQIEANTLRRLQRPSVGGRLREYLEF
jgi:RNA polymerase primary sigma factor